VPLPPSGDDARLDEPDEAIAEHLGVDAEVAPVAETRQHRTGDVADPHLDGRAVLHQVGDVAADAPGDLGSLPRA
jgi:phosphoserine phosphatase